MGPDLHRPQPHQAPAPPPRLSRRPPQPTTLALLSPKKRYLDRLLAPATKEKPPPSPPSRATGEMARGSGPFWFARSKSDRNSHGLTQSIGRGADLLEVRSAGR